MRKDFIKHNGLTLVNEALAFGPDHKYLEGTSLTLHLPPLPEGVWEIEKLWREGLAQLAVLIKEDPSLGEVEMIRGASWIPYSNPSIFEKLGFTVSSRDDEAKIAEVQMWKEKLFELYLPKGK